MQEGGGSGGAKHGCLGGRGVRGKRYSRIGVSSSARYTAVVVKYTRLFAGTAHLFDHSIYDQDGVVSWASIQLQRAVKM